MSDLELREHLANFLDGKLSRDEFEDWLVQESWNIHKSSDIGARRLVYAIELRLAENEQGHLPDEELHRELAQILKRPFVVSNVAVSSVQFISSSSSLHFIRQMWEVRSVDIRSVGASLLSTPR